MQPESLAKICFGLGLTTLAARGLLIWSVDNLYDASAMQLQGGPPEAIGPANILISVMALVGLSGAVWTLIRGVRGQMPNAAIAFNGVALLANPVAEAFF